jgi:hypothetical protein
MAGAAQIRKEELISRYTSTSIHDSSEETCRTFLSQTKIPSAISSSKNVPQTTNLRAGRFGRARRLFGAVEHSETQYVFKTTSSPASERLFAASKISLICRMTAGSSASIFAAICG